MRINREEFLNTLELLQPGLSPREAIEQSSCFVFRGGQILTYNEEVSCRCKSPLGDTVTGAVAAAPLLALLQKMPEPEIDVQTADGELLIIGKRRKSGVRMEAEIALPVDQVEKPETWKPLDPEFIEAVGLVQACAGRDESQFTLTCVHVTPKWVEACDNVQLARYRMKTGFAGPVLVRRDSIKNIITLAPAKFSETETWVHFKSATGVVLSCRRYAEDYHDLRELLNVSGQPMTLPRGLAEAAERADVFAAENAEFDHLIIKLRPGKLICRGEGSLGWFSETKKVKYAGQPLEFTISPAILSEIVKRHPDCEVSEKRLKVNGGKWSFVAWLGVPEKEAVAE